MKKIKYNVQGTHLPINKTFNNRPEAEAYAKTIAKKDTAILCVIECYEVCGGWEFYTKEIQNYYTDGTISGGII